MAKPMEYRRIDDTNRFLIIILVLMLLLILLAIIFACKPWRFFYRTSRTSPRIKDDDLERPLVSEDSHLVHNQSTEISSNYGLEAACHRSEEHFNLPQTHGLAYKQRSPLTHSDSFVLDISDPSLHDALIGQTLKLPPATYCSIEEKKYGRKEDLSSDSSTQADNGSFSQCFPKLTADQRSVLTLEVISGPSQGAHCSLLSTNKSDLPLTLGRVFPSDLLVKDSEVSGKHALINWNLNKLKWELVDMGSLNGTLLNSRAVHNRLSANRNWGDPVELASGDIITLGTTSKLCVQITSQFEQIPFEVGLASDPMALRRGGKKLPMEDVSYYQWPLPGADQFGLFGICDGHSGAAAATSASKIMPEIVASILLDTYRREKVLAQCDASDVLREAFSQTEAYMNHFYEGCTATVLLVWADGHENFYVQCANVGDSACIVNIDGMQLKMTEDHRVASYSERLRIQAMGETLREGETRLCGLTLARMLGDKYLKQQDTRFSSEPYVSQAVHIDETNRGFALLASDGFWDVVNFKRAVQLVNQERERNASKRQKSAEKIANFLLNEARAQRTKDNTSIIFLDFDTSSSRTSPCKADR